MRRLLLLVAALLCGVVHAVDYEFKTGDTSKLILVSMYKAADGTADTGLAYSSMTITYTRNNASADTDITEATMTMGTWASGGWVEVDATNTPGLYQFGIPDAALASGADNVVFSFKASGAVPKFIQASLVAVDFRGAAYIPANTVQIEGGDATNAINAEADTALADYDAPTNAEMVARTLPTASYFDATTDTVTTDSASRIASQADVSTLATTSALATAQTDLDTITGADGVTLATSQPNYAPNKITPPTVGQIRTEMETAGGSLALALEDTGTTLPATLATLATAAALATHDAKLDTVNTNVSAVLADTGELQTRFYNMIVADGVDWTFTAGALQNAPAGGGGGGDATATNQITILDRLAGIMSKDHTLTTAVGTFDPATDSLEAVRDNMTGTGSGDTRVNKDHLDDSGASLYAKTSGGAGIAGVTVRAYVRSEYDAGTKTVRAVTYTGDDGGFLYDIWLNTGTEYVLEYQKSGYPLALSYVTP